MNNDITNFIIDGNVELKVNNTVELMPISVFAKWCALINGMNEILNQAEKIGINVHKNNSWIQPLPLCKYIQEKSSIYEEELMNMI